MIPDPQAVASDPAVSAFVAANAGSGKTSTLVNRVARLLLRRAEPEAILCLTYTKAAAAEMQRRLFETLGGWSTLDDDRLAEALAKIGEDRRDLPRARTLFARALETPGGLKIQTIHAFCEKLLRRFPLEAGVSPGFTVLEGADQAEVQATARERLAELALASPVAGEAYAHFAVELAPGDFDGLLTAFECDRQSLAAYLERGDPAADVWRTCGFPDGEPADPDGLEAEAVAACDWARWRTAAEALLATGSTQDAALARKLLRLVECAATQPGGFADCLAVFSTAEGERAKKLGTNVLHAAQRDWLAEEQHRLHDACGRAKAARQAVDTVHALTLAAAYLDLYAGAKGDRGALDFPDLIQRTKRLLTETADAAWVLYKLDGGIDHVLVDEAQDTAPEQWDIVRALTADFFAGDAVRSGAAAGRGRRPERTVFAVGDEKQSIYGFQGAAPELLHGERTAYEAAARNAGRAFVGPSLEASWRSTQEVLGFVDVLGEDAGFRAGVQPASSDVFRHLKGRRDDTPGQVDLWPLFKDEPREEPQAWDAPLDAPPAESAVKRLAKAVAQAVLDMGARGEAVWDGKLNEGRGALRPVRPGDVLVLVRKRGAVFEEILRELKRADIAVAGADRLKLSDHIAFDDVLALVRFVLYPWDDLTLAALLRSPFCEVDEEALYALAQPREGRLYAELSRRGDERPAWSQARRFLGDMREAARGRGPFDLLGRAFGWLDAEGRTIRQRMVTRLGAEASEALDELLTYALGAEGRGVTDLQRFAGELERADVEVKRELEGAGADGPGQVRVMTVHGAKGLEAPVVILPDTCGQTARPRDALLKTGAAGADGEWVPDGGFLFAPREKDDTPASSDARAARKEREAHEQLRLLYVALTRARDRVIVAGRISARDRGPTRGGWYERIAEAFGREEERGGPVREVQDGGRTIRRYGPDPAFALASERAPASPDATPAWLRAPAPPEPEASRYASPSTYAEGRRGPAPSPLAASPGGLGRFRRGELVHRLLQLLPDLPAADRPAAAERILARERDLSDDQRREMARAALGVLEDPRFAEVWASGSKAEAAVAGSAPELPEGLAVSGRVDRLLVTPERVWVVDFKTNRPSPDRIEQADFAYVAQMAIYAAVLRAVFPGRRVEAALVWTDGPKLMPVPDNVMDAALQRIRSGR